MVTIQKHSQLHSLNYIYFWEDVQIIYGMLTPFSNYTFLKYVIVSYFICVCVCDL